MVGDGQCFRIVAPSAARIALDPDVWQKMHFDANLAVPFTGFAAAARGIEAEPPRSVAADFRGRQLRKQLPDQVEDASVSGRVTRRSIAQGLLIDADDLIDLFDTADFVVSARYLTR